MLQEAWGLAHEGGRALLVDAESKLMELNFINLEPKRSFTVAESVLWIELCGLRTAVRRSSRGNGEPGGVAQSFARKACGLS